MKQKVLYILLLLFACAWNTRAWGQTTCYVLNDATERSWSTIDNSGNYTLNGVGETLTFQAKRTAILGITNSKEFYAEYSKDGSKWENVLTLNLGKKDTWYDFSCTIPKDAKFVRFETKIDATGKKQIRNVKVTRRTTLTSSTTSLDFGETQPNKPITSNILVSYNNTYNPTNLYGSCSNNAFQIESTSLGETGDASVKLIYTPTNVGEDSGEVTLSMGTATYKFNVSGKCTIQKIHPNFFWETNNVFTNRDYPHFFSTSNNDCPWSISSSDESIAMVDTDGTLHTYNKTGSVTFTVHQDENEEWYAKDDSYTINISTPQNHLPCNLTGSNYQHYRTKTSGNFAWEDGVCLGDGGGGFNYDDKYFDLEFIGYPQTLTFDYKTVHETLFNATDIEWYVATSTDGNNWTKIWTSSSSSGKAQITINEFNNIANINVRHIRLCYSGNYGGLFYNVNISELKYYETNPINLDFGTNQKGNTIPSQNVVLSHCNASGMTSISVDDETNFSVSPTTLNTGGDRMGDETITVTYKNNTVGTHNAKVTISDGTNTKVINVTGTTQTVYYAKGNATATEGGGAYVSVSSFDDATTASVNKTSEATSETFASTTLYYKAAPNQYYEFLGWKNNLNDETFVSNESNYSISNFAYNSEDANNPTTKNLFAIFEPKTITLDPTDITSLIVDDYKNVTLNRTLKQGYNTLSLPFDTEVAILTGRNNSDDWVAQLALVTYNGNDGYTLYFTKVTNGVITANQPYILHLGAELVNPSWTNMTVVAAQGETVSVAKNYDWSMISNYTPSFSMEGKYGVVNSTGKIQKGANGSTLNAFTAYFTYTGAANVKAVVSYLDNEGELTKIEGVDFDDSTENEIIYDLQGRKVEKPGKGIYIINGKKIHK